MLYRLGEYEPIIDGDFYVEFDEKIDFSGTTVFLILRMDW